MGSAGKEVTGVHSAGEVQSTIALLIVAELLNAMMMLSNV